MLIRLLKLFSFLFITAFFLEGCVTDELARKDDVYIVRSQVNEQVIRLEDKMNMLSGEVERLSRQLERLDKRISAVSNNTVENRNKIYSYEKELEKIKNQMAFIKKDLQKEFNKKMDLVIDEVVKENQKIAEKINALSKTTTYDVGSYHIVKKGETLSEIASKYNVSIEDIMAANNIENPDRLRVGQKLFIPQQ